MKAWKKLVKALFEFAFVVGLIYVSIETKRPEFAVIPFVVLWAQDRLNNQLDEVIESNGQEVSDYVKRHEEKNGW